MNKIIDYGKYINNYAIMKNFIKLQFLFFSMAIFSCHFESTKLDNTDKSLKNEKSSIVKNDTIVFQSGGNGLADIKLVLSPEGKFSFYMKIIPQPSDEDTKVDIIRSKGEWFIKGDSLQLKFEKSKLDLNALFDLKYAKGNEFKIINERTININNSLTEINIWGVVCEKTIK